MKTAALCLVASLAVGGSAFAAERSPASPAHCLTIDKLKASLKDAKFIALDAGQIHFLQGIYFATPPISGLPDADNAFLAREKEGAFIVWMRGKCASTTEPTIIGPPVIDALNGISSGAGEKIYPDDPKDELKL